MTTKDKIAFTQTTLDRAAHLRNADEQERLLADPRARVLPLWKGKPLIAEDETGQTRAGWLPLGAAILEHGTAAPIFLGLGIENAPRFTQDVSAWVDPDQDSDALRAFVDNTVNRHPSFPQGAGFTSLRDAMGGLPPADAGDIAAARAILEWHRTHPFCARCGERSAPAQAGWQRSCPACGAHHFPRTDPVVIMLVTRGDEVLLGRSPAWPPGMYSLLAGFVEPGETIEAAVRREVMEEAGIAVGAVRYVATQPWPFPSSLMIGCAGDALDGQITLDPAELEDAIWVSRERCMAAMEGRDPGLLPARKGAIARSLLEMWLRDEIR